MKQTLIARFSEWDNTAYVPVIKVDIIAMIEKMLSTADAKFSIETSRGSSYMDEMKYRSKLVVDSAKAIASNTINAVNIEFLERRTIP